MKVVQGLLGEILLHLLHDECLRNFNLNQLFGDTVLIQHLLKPLGKIRLHKMHPGEITGNRHNLFPAVYPSAEHLAGTLEYKEINVRHLPGLFIVGDEEPGSPHSAVRRRVQKTYQRLSAHNLLCVDIHLRLIISDKILFYIHGIQQLFPPMPFTYRLFKFLIIDPDILPAVTVNKINRLACTVNRSPQVVVVMGYKIDSHLDFNPAFNRLENPFFNELLNLFGSLSDISILIRQKECKMCPVSFCTDFILSVNALGQDLCNQSQKLLAVIPSIDYLETLKL